MITSGFATIHVVVSVRHPITPYQPRKYEENKIVASIHAYYTRYFPANDSTNPDVF